MGDIVIVKLWHGGKLIPSRRVKYVGGETDMFEVEADKMSFFELADYAVEYGSYKDKKFRMLYLKPGTQMADGLVELHNDNDVAEMMKILGDDLKHMLHLYINGGVVIPRPSNEVDTQEIETIDMDHMDMEEFETEFEAHPDDLDLEAHRDQLSPTTAQVNPNVYPAPTNVSNKVPSATPSCTPLHDVAQDSADDESGSEDGSVSAEEVVGGDSDTDDEEWQVSVANIHKANKDDQVVKKELITNLLAVKEVVEAINESNECSDGGSCYEDSEGDVNSPGDSEDDDVLGKKHKLHVPQVTEYTDWTNWKWVPGTRFETRQAFKDAIRQYAVANGRNVTISISNNKRNGRVGATCVSGCPFKVYCTFHEKKASYLVRSVISEHNYQRNMSRNRQLTTDFVALEFIEVFKAKPHWSAKEVQDAVKEKYKILVTKWFAYKAKKKAHIKLHGSMKDHYSKIGSYLQALKEVNPTSTFELVKVQPGFLGDYTSDTEVFYRLFICFDGVKKGFLAGCRKLLCLDGCFLKTFLGGMLLCAIARDANDQMFPVAWAIVEGETTMSWTWFMDMLKRCLNVQDDGEGWTLVSDQQKGLLNAVVAHWPKAEHRNCARHIYANWHKKYKGEELKAVFWRAVRSYCVPDHLMALEEMKEICPDAAEDFMKQDPKVFCRCYLKTNTKSDVVVNNMAETFNGFIIQARSKPNINMLEDIRLSMMTRLVKNNMYMTSREVVVCPRIQAKLEKEKGRAYRCEVYPSSLTLYQVKSFDDVTVDLELGTCSCRKWDLTVIPCKHVCAVAGFLGRPSEEFVHKFYAKSMYLAAYQHTIPPMPSEKYWPSVYAPLDPPPVKPKPGRPKKNRRKDPHEDPRRPGKLTKHGMEMTCGICKEKGHNKRKCPQKGKMTEQVVIKRPRGRPKKNSATNASQTSTVTNSQPS